MNFFFLHRPSTIPSEIGTDFHRWKSREREREKKTNVAGRWAGPIVQRGPNRGVENKETWGGERPKKKKKKKRNDKVPCGAWKEAA